MLISRSPASNNVIDMTHILYYEGERGKGGGEEEGRKEGKKEEGETEGKKNRREGERGEQRSQLPDLWTSQFT